MRARYSTTCQVCPDRIQPGDLIVAAAGPGSSRWVHASCRTDSPADVPLVESKPLVKAVAATVPAGAVEVYTDGSCLVNPGGPGGWAWAIDADHHASGSDPATTNQRMEIQAVLETLRAHSGPLAVFSDSKYVVNCFAASWWRKWHSSGWLNSAKKPVANRDLWEPLVDLALERGDVTFNWVKGHNGHPMNELADQLAGAAARQAQASP